MRRAAVPILALALVACGRSCAHGGAGDGADGGAATLVDGAAAALSCAPTGAPFDLGVDVADVGDVVVRERAVLVSIARASGDAGARQATLVEVRLDGSPAREIVLGPLLGDDPPATLRATGAHVVAARIAREAYERRPLALRRIVVESVEPARLELAAVDEAADESKVMDLALAEDGSGIVTWDEDDVSGRRGIVKAARFPAPDGGRPAAVLVSSALTNSEAPRAVAVAGGFAVAYRAEEAIVEDGGSREEGAGEPRRHRWVELTALAPDGGVATAARVAGTRSAHVVSHDLVARGAATTILLHDEEQTAGEGAGGRVLGWSGLSVDVLVASGVHAAPVPIALGGLLAWVGADDATYVARADGGAAAPLLADAGARMRLVAARDAELFAIADDASRGGARLHRFLCR